MPTISNVGVFVSYSETRRILSMLARSGGTFICIFHKFETKSTRV